MDELGEWWGGVWDSVSTGTQEFVDNWVGDFLETSESANPESNRQNSPTTLQPNGQPVQTGTSTDSSAMLRYGVWALAGVGLLIAFMPRK